MALCGARRTITRVLASSLRTHRSYATENKVGYVVGVYSNDGEDTLTEAANNINTHSSGTVTRFMQYGGPLKAGKSRVLYGVSEEFPVVAVVGLGKQENTSNPLEERDEVKETIRTAVAAGCQLLRDTGISKILVDTCGDGEAAAEGAHLAAYKYQDLKSNKKPNPPVHCITEGDTGFV